MRKSNYDKQPATRIAGQLWKGWQAVRDEINRRCASLVGKKSVVVVVECYQGVHHEELTRELSALNPSLWVDTQSVFKSVKEIETMTYPYVTDDRLFGYRAHFTYADFLDASRVADARQQISQATGLVLVYGHGAAVVAPESDILVYVDMARWEIQLRFRRHEINGLGVENKAEGASYHYKRGYFVDWIVCDTLKKQLLPKVDYWLDTHMP